MARPSVALMLLTSLVMAEQSADISSDVRELRGELDQLRSEVRRCSSAGRGEDNTKILLDWLTDQVKEIQAEVRSLVTRTDANEETFARREELLSVNRALGTVDKHVREVELIENRQAAKLEEAYFDMNHLKTEREKVSKKFISGKT